MSLKRKIVILASLAATSPAVAAAPFASEDDPIGDGNKHAPLYYDIAACGVDLSPETGVYTLWQDMADPVPDNPEIPSSTKLLIWSWGLGTDPDSDPRGFPVPKGNALIHEFYVGLAWDGREVSAFIVDRRPLLVGEDAITTEIPFAIEGNRVSVDIDGDLFDPPETFMWRSGILDITSEHLGTNGLTLLDGCAFPYTPFPEL